ncbi:MAG: ABC transporter ATP-binding protein [Planctomycetota bacterium]
MNELDPPPSDEELPVLEHDDGEDDGARAGDEVAPGEGAARPASEADTVPMPRVSGRAPIAGAPIEVAVAGAHVEVVSLPPAPDPRPLAIEMRGVSKVYSGTLALDQVNLAVPRGEIFGFIGPNGAGKTTTLRILATLTRPTGGVAKVCGFDVARSPLEVRGRMGYLPDGAPTVSDLTVGEFLEFFAGAYGLSGARRRETVRDVLQLVDLSEKHHRGVATLSLGMRQRLGLARVLLHDPQVLLLDEPGTGLDPRARVEIREVLRELGALDKTILVSSHILGELNELCTSIGILEQGRIVFAGPLDEAKARVRGRGVEVRVGGGPEATAVAEGLLAGLDAVEEVALDDDGELLRVTLRDGASPGALARRLVENGLELLLLRPREIDLEDAFLSLTEGKLG